MSLIKRTPQQELKVKVYEDGRPIFESNGDSKKVKRIFDRFIMEKY